VIRLTPWQLHSRERAPSTHWTGGQVGPRAGPDAEAKRKTPCPHRDSNPLSSSPYLINVTPHQTVTTAEPLKLAS